MSTPTDKALFGQMVTRVARYWRRAVDQALLESNLSQATALPLLIISRRGQMARQGEIADELGLEGPSLVRIAEMLVSEQLVIRREDPTDRRAKLFSLTPLGRERVKTIEAALSEVRARLLQGLDDAEIEIVMRALVKIEASLLVELDR